jgi:putative ABC transport system permease protein
MDTLVQDIRFALRTLLKSPGFTLVAISCLALGIAANVTVFTPINTLLLRPLPLRDPGRVVALWMADLSRPTREGSWSIPDFQDLGNADRAFEATGLMAQRSWNLSSAPGEPERVDGARVTSSVLPMLGIDPILGRHLRAEEDESGRVLLISYALWQRRYAGDSSVVGRSISVNGDAYTIVGVLARGVQFPEKADIWLPLEPGAASARRDWRSYNLLARLGAGVSEAQAQTRVRAIMARLAERYPDTNARQTAWLENYRETFARDVRAMMLILLGAVAFVLLISCANVANLLLARAASRNREVAVRLALGAGRGRIVRQLLTESLLLAVGGGALGTLLGVWGIALIVKMLPVTLPYWMVFDVDRRVLAMTLGVSLLTVLAFGLVPALHASSPALLPSLKESSRGASAGRRATRLRGALVVAEIVLSLVLLVGAALMVQSFLRTQSARLGFDQRNVLTFVVSMQGNQYRSDTARVAFTEALGGRLSRVPGVSSSGLVAQLPVNDCCSWIAYMTDGRSIPPGERPVALFNVVSPGYFETMRVAVLSGRSFTAQDAIGTPPVLVVDRTFAERAWPGESPIGRIVQLGDTTRTTVVGVVGNVAQDDDLTSRNEPEIYRPFAQVAAEGWRTLSVVLRTQGDAAQSATAVRAAMRELDAGMPVANLRSMERMLHDVRFQPRVYGAMFAVFAIVALVLASIGLYGVMAYSVAQRTHEIGVRIALGARARDVVGMVLRSGSRLVLFGLAIGVPIAFGLAQVLRNALYGVSPSDPATFGGVATLITLVALVSTCIPALRASRVDPIVALRQD